MNIPPDSGDGLAEARGGGARRGFGATQGVVCFAQWCYVIAL